MAFSVPLGSGFEWKNGQQMLNVALHSLEDQVFPGQFAGKGRVA
jgi:hypothetical protein